MPEAFEDQCEMIWSHLRSILASAGMGIENLVLLRTYLASPEYRVVDAKLRKKYLGDHEVALTVISAMLLQPSWKLEVEAVASA
jgi:2-iminobutanoate/2-iminopropanoate deaminase